MKTIDTPLPDLITERGKAWRVPLADVRKRYNLDPSKDATIISWVVEAKWAHPAWCNYFITAVHLRPLHGAEATILLEGATHEVWLWALDPDRVPSIDNPMASRLEPVNFVGQWRAASDIDAQEKIDSVVQAILAGQLSPDTDYRWQWIERFSASNQL